MTNTFWLSTSVFVNTMFEDSEKLQILFEKACETNNVYLVDLILLLPFKCVDPTSDYVFETICNNGYVDIVDRLLQEPKSRINKYAIAWVCQSKHVAILDRILQKGNVNISNKFIHLVSISGHVDVVDRLLHAQKNYRNKSQTICSAINAASLNGNITVLDRLLQESEAEIEEDVEEAQSFAILGEHLDCFELLSKFSQNKQ